MTNANEGHRSDDSDWTGEIEMDAQTKKTALRMIPYGLYVLTAKGANGDLTASTVNWVTQTAFDPPLVVVGVKTDSSVHDIVKDAGSFALNFLSKEQSSTAYAFFKPAVVEDGTLSGEPYRTGSTGAPILESVPATIECKLVETVERADHSIFVGEVVDAHVAKPPEGRPDDVTLTLRDLGDKVFYGG